MRTLIRGGTVGNTTEPYSADVLVAGDAIAAAWGGTATVIDFAIQTPGQAVPECLDRWHQKAPGNCAVDYGFHMILGGVDEDALKAMDHLADHNPAGTTVLGAATHHMNLDYPAYEGITVAGAVRTVLSRGTRGIDAGRFPGRAGHGRYLARGLSSYLR